MSTAYEIPLTAVAQDFTIALGGVTYTLTVFWNRAATCWMLNIADALGAPLVMGIPLITGTDLLRQYAYLGISGSLVVQTDYAVDNIPTIDNLGTDSHLYFVVG
jgi:hypothetical protein